MDRRWPHPAGPGLVALGVLALPAGARAQHHHPTAAPDTTRQAAHATHAHPANGGMRGLYGAYAGTREASGTAWQPDAARHAGRHGTLGGWMTMFHAMADVVWDDQGGPRGDEKLFSSNMAMGVAQRPLGGSGTLGLRAMLSAEPATIGDEGYPLLLQTGETADGSTPLIDRQHPHDLFMELAGTVSLGRNGRSVFLYGGLPGEPALGPPAFMHRFSGTSLPAAPLSHHWLDSSHITFGVVTGGIVVGRIKAEASAFRGREPDERRWNIESPKLDSHAFRLSLNPAPRWALQVSHGRLEAPEQLEPDVDVDRTTSSAMYAGPLGAGGHLEATLAWGRNRNRPGPTLEALTLEAAAELGGRHTIFGRAEHIEKNELFPEDDPRADEIHDVGAVTAGYRHDFVRARWTVGLGAAGTVTLIPAELRDVYGRNPTSVLLFLHAAL